MSTNASLEFGIAEKKFSEAQTDEEKFSALEEMISTMPAHKGAEGLRANLRQRYKKLKEKIETAKKKSKGKGKPGLKKAELQAVLIGLTQSGKSSILASLTNFKPEITGIKFTTKSINLGTLDYDNVKIQIVDLPAIESEYFDQGLANSADTLIIVITNPQELAKIFPFLEKAIGEKLIVLNKIDLLEENEKRRFLAQLQSKKYNFTAFSSKTLEGTQDLKDKIFKSFNVIRVYTKEPKKSPSLLPIVMPQNSTVSDIAEKIHAGFSTKIKEARVTGPSSKFPNQRVSPDHILKDRDIIEFYFD